MCECVCVCVPHEIFPNNTVYLAHMNTVWILNPPPPPMNTFASIKKTGDVNILALVPRCNSDFRSASPYPNMPLCFEPCLSQWGGGQHFSCSLPRPSRMPGGCNGRAETQSSAEWTIARLAVTRATRKVIRPGVGWRCFLTHSKS